LESSRCGANYDGGQPLRKFDELFTVQYLVAEFNFGKSFKTWVATPSNGSTWKNDSAPMKWVNKDATSFDDLPTTLENFNDPMPSTPSTGLWNFGKQNGSANPYRFGHHGSWLRIGHATFDNFSPPTST